MDNAFTSQDFTAYFENLAADRVTLALELEADRMQGLILDANEFKTEREVVKEERRFAIEDDPQGALVEALVRAGLYESPLPLAGDRMVLRPRRDEPRRSPAPLRHVLFTEQCHPARGRRHQSGQLASNYRQTVRADSQGPSPKPLAVAEAQQRGERRFFLKREAQVPFVMMGFRVPNYVSDDSYALNVLESILSHGKSARLYQSLVYEQKTALAVGADYGLMQADPGTILLLCRVKPGEKVEAVEEAVIKEIHRLQTEPPSELELQRAKNQDRSVPHF